MKRRDIAVFTKRTALILAMLALMAFTGCQSRGGSDVSFYKRFASVMPQSSSPNAPDFTKRCQAPGVIKCVGFDATADLAGTYGDSHGSVAGAAKPQLDSTIKASGASSLQFTIPSNSPADTSGSYFTNFSDDLAVQFGENADLYVQWRQRFSSEFLAAKYAGGGGWKQVIVGSGDHPGCTASTSARGNCRSSCTALEVVAQNTYTRGFAQMYNSCTGSSSHGPYDPFQQPFGSYDFKLQNARPSPYCLYSQPARGACFVYFPNEWMTFQIHIKTGRRVGNEFSNSLVQLWIGREGLASEPVIDWGPYNLAAGDPAVNDKFGKVWLLPYNTGKDPSMSYPTAYTWYDELIISRNKAADPSSVPQ